MPVNLSAPDSLRPVAGVRLASTAAGIRYQGRDDLLLIELCEGTQTVATFTRNAFCAAPVTLAKQHLSATAPRFLLINAGNANAGTGQQGMDNALASCAALADSADVAVDSVLPFSTGVIGEQLAVDRLNNAIPAALTGLHANAWLRAAHTIMTTDTIAKGVSEQFDIHGTTVTITGIAKGSGMIRPDMATMLAFIATDAAIERDLLQDMLSIAVESSFNRITVDGDTSTNDACTLSATGRSGAVIDVADAQALKAFQDALAGVCQQLAQAIIRDGEGATKFITVAVSGGQNEDEVLQTAYTVAHSPLVKTAFFASDPNWGRILAAVGRSGLADLDINKVSIHLNDLAVIRNGEPAAGYSEAQGQAVMAAAEITIDIRLQRGTASAMVWTSDLSHDYVTINAEYRT